MSGDDTRSLRPEADEGSAEGIDTSVPQSARIWNYWLGGKDNYPADRAAGDEFCRIYPGIVDMAKGSRYLLARIVRHLAGPEARIRQFLDIGTGLPTVDNTHQIAQRVAPAAKIVYVDHDPLVLAHARALLTSTPEGVTEYVHADLREPDEILAEAAKTLDFTQPVALMLMGVLGHIDDYDTACAVVDRLKAALPSGSHLALYDATDTDPASVEAHRVYNEGGSIPYVLRSREQIGRYFDGLVMLEPGLVPLQQWRPDFASLDTQEIDAVCAVARKA